MLMNPFGGENKTSGVLLNDKCWYLPRPTFV
jgi:hypothetical protein